MAVKIDLGPVGAVVEPGKDGAFLEQAVQLERRGFPTLWAIGGPLERLDQLGGLVEATQRARVGSSIIAIDRFGVDEVAGFVDATEASHPGRFVLGLGGARGPQSFGALEEYLDRLDERGIGADRRILAALGPRALDLAGDRAAGAFPVLVTPEYTAQARERLGADATLVVEQFAVVEPDPERARAVGRGPLTFMSKLPAYQASFRRQGFDDQEVADLADRFVDGVVAWGDADAVADRIRSHRDAGADHVAVIVMGSGPDWPAAAWTDLAERLL
jgi:probable F420-dependent oxidoreductase